MTEAIKSILNRTYYENQYSQINEFSLGLEELVNFGTHILDWDLKEAKGSDENIPVIMLLRNFLEQLDSISILIKNSSIDPSKSILRSLIETYFSLEYILEKNTVDRAMAFLVCHYKNDLKMYHKLNPISKQHQNLKGALGKNGIKVPVIPDIDQHIVDLQDLLSLPNYQNAITEYDKIITSGRKNPNWYELFGGPQSIENLANCINKQAFYETYYRHFSDTIHPVNIIQGKLKFTADKKPAIVNIRHDKDLKLVTMAAYSTAIAMYTLLLKKRINKHKEDFKNWYIPQISDYFKRILKEDY